MKIKFLGGANEVGRSAILINKELLLDYGIKPTTIPQFPIGDLRPKTVLFSHGHLDHCGLAANLTDLRADTYCTPMTKNLAMLLAKDTLNIAHQKNQIIPFEQEDIKDFERFTKTKNYNKSFKSNGYEITFLDAGHILGSAMIHVKKDDETLLYTGDFNTNNTQLQNGANLKHLPESKTLIIESTYYGRNHVNREKTEKRFIASIRDTLKIGGNAIIPAFAIGRTQEILIVLKKYGIFAYVDGMGRDVGKMINKYPNSIADIKLFSRSFDKNHIIKPDMRKTILNDEPKVIVTTAGMLNGGPVLSYIERIKDDPRSKILLTGYQVEGTNGRLALEHGIINIDGEKTGLKCKLEQYNFSAHAGDVELKKMIKKCVDNGTEKVIVIHGDRTQEFANWIELEIGVHARAPKIGDLCF